MRKIKLAFISLLSVPLAICAQPKLVVGVVVDQMRWDYLYRYQSRYSELGFKRILKEGFTCQNTYINYVPTVTAIGHSSIYTGSVPAIHGITGNTFIIQETGAKMYCAQDDSVQTVGAPGVDGKMSPKNLLVSTITDQLRLATNFRSKVIGISLKDRGAILPAGHFANAAYWMDEESGNWISSTYYMNKLPDWVQAFNDKKLVQKYLDQDWNTLYPVSTYQQSLADGNSYEGKFRGDSINKFPVPTSKLRARLGFGLIETTPYGNTLTLDLARQAIIQEQLGRGKNTDFLAISLSSTDYVGHQFAPNSIKTEDTYLRLDKDLGAFLQFLDQQLGKGNYTLFLTADHGAAHNPQFFTDQKGNGGYFDSKKALDGLNDTLLKQFGFKDLTISLTNNQVHLNNPLIKAKKLPVDAIRKAIVQYMRDLDGVSMAVDMDQLGAVPALIRERIVNGYNYKRSGAVQYILEAQIYSGSARATGTTHGSWYPYDAHIPLLWMGWGVRAGKTNRVTNMTDIAPTVAALLNIEEPNGNIGAPITELMK